MHSPLVGMLSRYCLHVKEQRFWDECAARYIQAIISKLPLIHKIILGFLQICLKEHLRKRPDAIQAVDPFGRTALWWATAIGDLEKVQILLNYGAGVDARDYFGRDIVCAASHGRSSQLGMSRIPSCFTLSYLHVPGQQSQLVLF